MLIFHSVGFSQNWRPEHDKINMGFDSLNFSNKFKLDPNKFQIGVWFHENVNFEHMRFYGISNLSHSKYDKTASFISCRFIKDCNLFGSTFNGNAKFRGSVFDENANFVAQFYSFADFSNCLFKGESNIRAEFNENVLFKNSEFIGDVSFKNAKFFGTANFENVKFMGSVDFGNIILPDTLNFSYIRNIKENIDFRLSKNSNSKICYINLFNSDLGKIKIDYLKFRLYFPPIETRNDFNKDIIILDPITFEQSKSVYLSLLDQFKQDGLLDSYKELDLEFKKFESTSHGSVWKICFYYLPKYWFEFGYSKWWIFIWIGGFLFSFSLIFLIYFFKNYNKELIYPVTFIENYISERNYLLKRSFYHRLFYLSIASIIYCSIIFFGFKLSIENIKKVNIWLIYIFTVYSIGLICLGYLFNFIISK